ncbi:E3 ubiquitin-protein ligase RNF12-A [Fukomys damarensis]|uniref:RING-type E3 ubiquitin transferase n=1 Tax=Fukomys damarensis TaxID=885580 RepID=A0A091DWX4_FUKDA|nr:E3 ubiquitin-protein ligase RNF12-A [Fukomys damarensis]
MESSEEDESTAQGQADRLVREEAYYRFVNSITEEDYRLMRDNNLFGIIGESTEEELAARLRQIKDTLLLGAGAQDLSNYYGGSVKITSFTETEHMTESEQTESLSWTLGNPSTTSSSDTRRPNLEPEESLFSRLLREYMENLQSVSTVATSSTSQEHTTEALMEDQERTTEALMEEQGSTAEAHMEDPSIRIRRSRRRRQRKWRHRTRNESGSHPDTINQTAERLHHNISSEGIEEASVSETETVSRNEPHAVLRQQVTRSALQLTRSALQCRDNFAASELTDDLSVNETETVSRNEPHAVLRQVTRSALQCRDNFAASELTDDLSVEFSPHASSNRESVESRTRHTLVVPDFQVTIFPGEQSLRDDTDTILEIPETLYTCTSVESAQEELRNIFSRAEAAGIRSDVGTLRIPAFRSSNSGLGATASSESQGRPFEQSTTRFAGLSNVIDSDSDLEFSGLPPTQNIPRAESQNRRDSSNLNLSFESLAGAAAMYDPSFGYSTGASFNPMFSTSSHYENPEILQMMFGDINERRESLVSRSQAGQEIQHAHSEIANESEAWLTLDDVVRIDVPTFNQPTGLTKQQIDNLAVRVFNRNDTPQSCSVCLTECTHGNKLRILPCSHEYHVHCIDPWLADNSTCPICHNVVTGYGDR